MYGTPFAFGLSPPTRGNLILRGQWRDRFRSIPAHAGEPSGGVFLVLLPLVYPRPRGGTPLDATSQEQI